MAKKRRSTATRTKIVRVAPAKAPIIKVTAPRAAPAKKRRSSRRGGGGARRHLGGLVSSETVQMAVGGAVYGFLVKSGLVAKLPAIPIVGRTGAAAILLDYWSRNGGGQWPGKAARAAAAIAGYQLGHDGTIQGGDIMLGDATTPGSLSGDDMEGEDMDGEEYE